MVKFISRNKKPEPPEVKQETETAPRARRSNQLDKETEGMIFQGANLSQLAKLFHMDRRDVTEKMSDKVTPCGTRGGYPIYYVHEVAPHLVKPIYDIENYIKRMHHNDLPKHLSKEFWAGARAKQLYEEEAKHLWRTEAVIETLSEAFKTMRMSLLLMGDAIERESVFTEKQREKLQGMVDGALNDLADALVKRFEGEVDGQETEDI